MVEYREKVAVPRVAIFLTSAAELEYLHNAELFQGITLIKKNVAVVRDKHGMEYRVHKIKATIMDSQGKWARSWCRARTPKHWGISNEFEWLEEEPQIEDLGVWDEEV